MPDLWDKSFGKDKIQEFITCDQEKIILGTSHLYT